MRKAIIFILCFLFSANFAYAAKPATDMSLAWYWFSGSSKYLRLVDCHLTDDYETQVFTGDLNPNESFTVDVPFCYSDQYLVLVLPDESSDEDYAFEVTGRGDLNILFSFVSRDETRPLIYTALPVKGQAFDVQGCFYAGQREVYTSEGVMFKGGDVRVTLIGGERGARNVTLATYIALAGSPIFPQFC